MQNNRNGGAMEYWNVAKEEIDLLIITPSLHYSNTPILNFTELSLKLSPNHLGFRGVLIKGS